ncbi:hypothetical protein VTK73DRAFT_3453 [Phialemonium thermophilum]|uniref:Uncharacterized protein n=1 Tax=Phialemonium thermophilum TaxID=223376 RepID=A0ABR3WZI0_9PEZI
MRQSVPMSAQPGATTIVNSHPCTRRVRVTDAHALDDGADGQQQRQVQGVEARLGRALAAVPPRVLVDEPVGEPACVRLADEAADEQRDAEDEARLRRVEAVVLAEDDRARGSFGKIGDPVSADERLEKQ